jgi:tetratricopeptide (TPR) repeat protein
MRHETAKRTGALVALGALLLAVPALAQYREYYVHGRVLDTEKKPLADAQIEVVDPETSRTYHMKTDEKGEYKYAGLPHALYKVTYSHPGYVSVSGEWEFKDVQERMQKRAVPDVYLQSEAMARKVQRFEGAKAGVEEAGEKIQNGDLDGAIAAVRKALADSPDDPSALFYLGLAYAGKKQCSEAIDPLTRVTQLTPEFANAWFELGVCYRALGQPDKALAAYEQDLSLDPQNADAAYNSGLILFAQSKIEEALAHFEKGLAVKPDDTELNDMAGRCYLHEGKIDVALQHLEKARATAADPEKIAFLDKLIEQAKAVKK